MSRLVKLNNKNPLSKPVERPNQVDNYYLVGEIYDWPFSEKERNLSIKSSSRTRRRAGLDLHNLDPLDIEIGAARTAAHLYKALEADQGALSTLEAHLDSTQEESSGDKTSTFQSYSTQIDIIKRNSCIPKSPTISFSRTIVSQSHNLDALLSVDPTPGLDSEDFYERFFFNSETQPEVIILAISYIERAMAEEKSLRKEHFKKLFVGCFLLAHKFLNEKQFWGFADLGYLARVRPQELGEVEECVFSKVLKHRLYTKIDEFDRVQERVVAEAL